MWLWLKWKWLEFRWWWMWDRAGRDFKIKFQQRCWVDMPDDKWGDFVDSLSFNEFLYICCMGQSKQETF